MLLGNLFRDQLDRYGELEIIADRWAEIVAGLRPATALVLNADDPLVADLGRDREARLLRRRRTTRWRCPSSSTRRTPSTAAAAARAYVYDAAYLAHLGRYALPELRRAPPRRRRCARPTSSCAASARRAFTLAHAGGRAPDRAPAPRPLQRLQRARRRRAVPARSACRSTTSAAGLAAVAPAFGRAETIELAGRPTVDPARQEPGRRQRGAAHARARGRRSSTCSACSTTASPTAATSRGCGTPTGSSSPRTCAG